MLMMPLEGMIGMLIAVGIMGGNIFLFTTLFMIAKKYEKEDNNKTLMIQICAIVIFALGVISIPFILELLGVPLPPSTNLTDVKNLTGGI